MNAQVKLYSLNYNCFRTYVMSGAFVIGNVLLPQICHQISLGGPTWLPIYFFTLIGAYKYGWKVGLLTALLSPIINSLLFGMPVMASVFDITVKSVLLATFAGLAAARYQKASLLLLSTVVLMYQIIGCAIDWVITGNLYESLQDFRIGIPGMLVQVFGGWLAINKLTRQ